MGPPPTNPASAMGAVRQVVDEGRAPARPLRPRPPRGFRLDREATVSRACVAGVPAQVYEEPYVRATDVIVVQQAPSNPAPRDESAGRRVLVPGIGFVRIQYYVDRLDMTFRRAGRAVRVSAPTDAQAAFFARSL